MPITNVLPSRTMSSPNNKIAVKSLGINNMKKVPVNTPRGKFTRFFKPAFTKSNTAAIKIAVIEK